MRFTKRMRAAILSCALVFTLAISAVSVFAYDGSADPIISLSYLNQFKASEIDPKISALEAKVNAMQETVNSLGTSGGTAATFTVLELYAGQTVFAGESCEIILRSGEAFVILAPESLGGISDITAGVDLTAGTEVSKNHLLLVPRNDGRGIFITSDIAFVMVKGAYRIE